MRIGFREIVLVLILLALPAAAYFLVFAPQHQRIQLAQKEVEHKREMLAKLKEETKRNEDLIRANEDVKNRVSEIESRLPNTKEVDLIVRQVSTLAVECGLDAPALTSAKPVAASLYMEQPLQMETKGSFDGYYKFLQSVEKLPRITRILDMSVEREDTTDGVMEVAFTLSIYFQDEKGAK